MNSDHLRIGLAQIAPIWLNKNRTLNKIIQYVQDAAKTSCKLICFGESLVPGYPFWIGKTNGAQFQSDIQKDFHAHYLSEAVDIEAGDLAELQAECKLLDIACVLGTIEKAIDRGGKSVYCSLVYISAEGEIMNVHRKLMPTYEERLSWAQGDGHGLRVFPIGNFTMGALNCWENWMPLPRAALYGMGEDLHIALWPGGDHNTHDITKFIAKESRSFVVSVSGIMRRSDILQELPHSKLMLESSPEWIANGASCVAGPDGEFLLEPQIEKEGLFTVDIDFNEVRRERHNFDPVGHYSRPDVTRLEVNRSRQSTIKLID